MTGFVAASVQDLGNRGQQKRVEPSLAHAAMTHRLVFDHHRFN